MTQRPNGGQDTEAILRAIAADQWGGSLRRMLCFLGMRLREPAFRVDRVTRSRIERDLPLLRKMAHNAK